MQCALMTEQHAARASDENKSPGNVLKAQYLFTLRKSCDTYSNMSLGVFRMQRVIRPGLFYSSRSIWHCADTADGTFRLTSPNALRIVLSSPAFNSSPAKPDRLTSPSQNRLFSLTQRPHRSPPCALRLSYSNLHTGGGEKRMHCVEEGFNTVWDSCPLFTSAHQGQPINDYLYSLSGGSSSQKLPRNYHFSHLELRWS